MPYLSLEEFIIKHSRGGGEGTQKLTFDSCGYYIVLHMILGLYGTVNEYHSCLENEGCP